MTAGTVTGLASLEAFLRGRLRTAGLVAAGIAAAACAHSARAGHAGEREPGPGNWNQPLVHSDSFDFWGAIDAEADARTPSPAQRAASRRQGRALLRAARIAWPEDRGLADLAAAGAAVIAGAGQGSTGGPHRGVAGDDAAGRATGSGASPEYRGGPHHAVVLGAAAAAAGCDAVDAARIAAYQSVAGPASAAVRLLALDPMRATAVLARLSRDIDPIAERAAAAGGGPLAELPCPSAPALDLLAEAHIRAEVRLFES